MTLLFFITSGLFLGWLLGANDTVNVFGSSVSSKMLNSKKAAFIAGLFILIGATFQGRGTTNTIRHFGQISEPSTSFIIALCAAAIVFFFVKIKLKVSTSQAIIGGIVGWSIFARENTDIHLLFKIVLAWILAPLTGLIMSALLFVIMRWLIKKSKIHVIKLDLNLRIALIFGISLSAFGLGANNIGNVIGVFSGFSPNMIVDFGIFSIDGMQVLFLLGGISIALGIFTYSWQSVDGTENDILSLAPEATIVVLLSQAIVLFMFSSSWLEHLLISSGLPSIPLVPVSSTQIVVGALLGIGIIKGAREVEYKTLAGIGLGWLTTPIGAGLLTYLILLIRQKVFNIPTGHESRLNQFDVHSLQHTMNQNININMILPGVLILSTATILVFILLYFRQQKLRYQVEKDMLIQQNQLYHSQKALNELEMKTISMENEVLHTNLKSKRKEFMEIALSINEQRIFLEKISDGINEIVKITEHETKTEKLKELSFLIKQKMSFSNEKKEFYLQIEEVHKDFHMKLKNAFPNLTELEKRFAGLLRLSLSTKEISTLLNISPKSVEVARYRLKKKMNLDKDKSLTDFINNL